jgi:hypothetical protein
VGAYEPEPDPLPLERGGQLDQRLATGDIDAVAGVDIDLRG